MEYTDRSGECPYGQTADMEMSLGMQLLVATKRIQHLQMKSAWSLIPRTQFMGLVVIDHECKHAEDRRGVSVSTIAKHMHGSMPATSRMLAKLEEQGLIQRETDSNDRRNTLVSLTQEGKDACHEGRELVDEYADIIAEQLGEEQVHRLIVDLDGYLEAMGTALETMKERHPELEQVTRPAPPDFPPPIPSDMDEEGGE